MKTGDLASAAAKMNLAMKSLRSHWQSTRSQWNDSASLAFENNHLADLEPQISATLAAVARLAEVLQRARQECSDEAER
jgi:hypothetical protein